MKKLLWLLLGIFLAMRVGAQSNAPVRLALIAETPEASAVSDLLTAELSKNPQVTLLERNEIERVYREQGISAGNKDYLKMGQLLGADGLLLIRATPAANGMPAAMAAFASSSKPSFNLNAQLIAVKPGVLLDSEQFSAVGDIAQWANGFAVHLNPQLPKLSVLMQDALPISIVNLRAAMKSPETEELERQFTALTIQRLSHEPQLFVLERRKMQLLTSEKELQGLNNTSFWNGSYLLEGTLDRNGYSKDTITIDAQLTPPKGGAPIAIEVSGARTNLSEVINRLAEKVRAGLKLARTAMPWNTADEAQKYFEEAKWALRWGIFEQAQNASESAWALGKQDMDCAMVRLNAYASAIPEVDPVNVRHINSNYVSVTNRPDAAELDNALQLLNIYEQFGRTLPSNEPQQDSPYYISGLNALHKATGVLRHFHFHTESQADVSEKLADLRATTRGVDSWIGRSPSVRQMYWIDGHIPSIDEIHNYFRNDSPRYADGLKNLYEIELQSGRFWQDKPEDCLALYRSLMKSPLFASIHNDLWFSSEERFVAWNPEDQKRLPALWQGFIAELDNSTNAFLGMEGRISEFATAERGRRNPNVDWTKIKDLNAFYAEREKEMEVTWTNLFEFVFSHYDQIVTGREQLLFTGLGLGALIPQEDQLLQTCEKLDNDFRTVCTPRLNALHDDYRSRFSERLKQLQGLPTFDAQKQFLASFAPYNAPAFDKLFNDRNYSKAQAAELKPLMDAYCSNLMAQATNSNLRFFAQSKVDWIKRMLGNDIDRLLAPEPQPSNIGAVTSPPPNQAPTATPAVANVAPVPLEPPANVLVLKTFVAYPKTQLPASNVTGVVVLSHRVRDDRLILDLRYIDQWIERTTNSSRRMVVHREAAAVLGQGGTWSVTPFPHHEDLEHGMVDLIQGSLGPAGGSGSKFYLESFQNAVYVSDMDAIRRFDQKQNQWRELPFPGQSRAQLYAVGDHLYAASSEDIWEVLDGGQSSRILASTRRRPTASILDSRDSLDSPVLFPGKDGALDVALNGDVFAWDGNDWKPVLNIPSSGPAEIFEHAVLFRTSANNQAEECWRLPINENQAELCLRERQMSTRGIFAQSNPAPTDQRATPKWNLPPGLSLGRMPVAADGSNLYFLLRRSAANGPGGLSSGPAVEKRGRFADLVCLVPNCPAPLIVPFKFDLQRVPAQSAPQQEVIWMDGSKEFLYFGWGITGVWELPKTELNAELDRQVKDYNARKSETEKTLLAKYDLNHNGVIDSAEKESAVNDPAFLESELEKIDADDNCLLELRELSYFDANKNGLLDPAEEAGIHLAQGLLAGKLFKGFDWNEDGKLDYNEARRIAGNNYQGTFVNGAADVETVKRFLETTTDELLGGKNMPGGMNPIGSATHMSFVRMPSQTTFKQRVEEYWAKQKSSQDAQKP